jgi:hypothetical protein
MRSSTVSARLRKLVLVRNGEVFRLDGTILFVSGDLYTSRQLVSNPVAGLQKLASL